MSDMRRLISLTTGAAEEQKETLTEGSVMENFARWGNDLEEDETLNLDEEGVEDLEEEDMEELDEAEMEMLGGEELGDDLVEHVASLIHQGYTEGHHPRWVLHVGEEVTGDEFAMQHIADLVRKGMTSGNYPHWTLVIERPETKPEPVALEEIENDKMAYGDWFIYFDPKPIPDRRFDYSFYHKDYDGEGDPRHGHAESVEAAQAEIDDMEAGD